MADAIEKVKEGLVVRGDCVVVIIDVQDKMAPRIHENDKVVENIIKFIRFARIVGLPIVVTEQRNLGMTVERIKKELPRDMKPIEKLAFDCLGSIEFMEELHRLKKETLLLVGIETHICVAQTALHAARKFNVHVLADATGSRSPAESRVGLDRMTHAGVTVSSTEMAIFELLGEAGTDEFRSVLPLLK